MIILCILIYNYILLEISGSHSNIFSDSYVFHYGNELVSRTGNKEIRHFVTTNFDQKYPFAVYHTSTHGVPLVRIKNAGLKCATLGSLEIQDAKMTQKWRKKIAICTLSDNFSGCIFANKACIGNRKKNLLNINISSRCSHNIANFGPLTGEICWRVWGTPANFNGFRILASLLQRCRSPEANQTLHDVWPSPALVHYTLCSKKVDHQTHGSNFVKS